MRMARIALQRCSRCGSPGIARDFSSSSSSSSSRSDPTAKRPNRLCDPYGQGGKPMAASQAQQLLQSTLNPNWSLDSDSTLLQRRFLHDSYGKGARFVQTVAAAAEQQAHFPQTVQLERSIAKSGAWKVETLVECQTVVLRGLSINDFHLAMMIDVETDRPEIRALLASDTKEEQ